MRNRVDISAGGVLLLAALSFFLRLDEFAALACAALAHEAGHIAAIYLCGGRVLRLRLGASGPVIDRTPSPDRAAELFCCLAGPAGGLLFALALAEGWPLAAGMSLALSAFNALPALPLDGGRALAAVLGEGAAAACSLVTASLCLLAGLILAAEGFGPTLPLPGAALLLMQARL